MAVVLIHSLRRQLTGLSVILAVVAALSVSSATATPLLSLSSLKPAPAPSGWRVLVPKSGSSRLWYPPSMKKISGDPYSVSAALIDRNGADVLYLNAGPKTGDEKLSTWPSFRLDHIRAEQNRWVHEDAHAFGVPFRGGHGSCVLDDYVTRVHANHYREIACFVQGRTAASVIVAAALAKAWPRYGQQLERAVEAWQVR
jgi:hypothetical protein